MPRRNWPREKLIALGDCDFNCLRSPCCTAGACINNNGYFEQKEIEQFSEKQRKQIKEMWSKKTGYWSSTGCRLPRKLRAYKCLAYDCRYVPVGVAH